MNEESTCRSTREVGEGEAKALLGKGEIRESRKALTCEEVEMARQNEYTPRKTSRRIESGEKFGKLMAMFCYKRNGGPSWICKCECGNITSVIQNKLRSGHTTSCGCYKSEWATANKTKHGYANDGIVTSEWSIWSSMKQRCCNPNNESYHRYGGRGISVCERWVESFQNFIEDMGDRPSEMHSIDRRDNDGNYCPENCSWETRDVQLGNTCRSRRIEVNGESRTLKQWAVHNKISPQTISSRLRRGWNEQESVTRKTK